MQHEEHASTPVKGFGTNTSGLGLLIVAVVAVCLALFCWNYFGSKEAAHYRYSTTEAAAGEGEHGESEKAEAAPAAEHGEAAKETSTADTAKTEVADTTKPAADTTKH